MYTDFQELVRPGIFSLQKISNIDKSEDNTMNSNNVPVP